MPHPDSNPSRSDELLSAKLRHLGRSSALGASPEVEGLLVNAFRRHHRRRKVLQMATIVAVLVLIAGGSVWRWYAPDHRQLQNHVVALNQTSGLQQQNPANGTEAFVPLPAFAFSNPYEDFRIIRVEIPASSLRLLGAHVNDDLITQRVVADLLVGVDGTPYAFRLIS